MAGSAHPARGAPIVDAGSNSAPNSPRQIQQTREESSSQPLTHHQLLALVTPFSRDGRDLDMAATDRAARRLVFKPLSHSLPASPLHEALSFQEVLTLSQIQAGIWRLSRDLSWPVATQQRARSAAMMRWQSSRQGCSTWHCTWQRRWLSRPPNSICVFAQPAGVLPDAASPRWWRRCWRCWVFS